MKNTRTMYAVCLAMVLLATTTPVTAVHMDPTVLTADTGAVAMDPLLVLVVLP